METYILLLFLTMFYGQNIELSKAQSNSAQFTFQQLLRQCRSCVIQEELRQNICSRRNEICTRCVKGGGGEIPASNNVTDMQPDARETPARDKFVQETSPVFYVLFAIILMICIILVTFCHFMKRRKWICIQCDPLAKSHQTTEHIRSTGCNGQRTSTVHNRNECDLLSHKKYAETLMDNEESLESKDTEKYEPALKKSSQDSSLLPEKQKRNQFTDLEEVSNSKVLHGIQELKERTMCKICLNRKMCVVFLPCNHMLACENCSMMLDRCAVCRTIIKGSFSVHTQF